MSFGSFGDSSDVSVVEALWLHCIICWQSLWQQDSYETAITDRTQQRQDSYETAPEDSLYDEDIHGQDDYYDEDYEGHWDRRGYPGHVSMDASPAEGWGHPLP